MSAVTETMSITSGLSQSKRLFLGVLVLLTVDAIWVASSELTRVRLSTHYTANPAHIHSHAGTGDDLVLFAFGGNSQHAQPTSVLTLTDRNPPKSWAGFEGFWRIQDEW